MKDIRAIRAFRPDLPKYVDIFMEESGMNRQEFWKLCTYYNNDYSKAMEGVKGHVNCLTAQRKYLISKGYEEAVKRTDERFLKERVYSDCTPEEYDAKWEEYLKVIPEKFPPDAL